MDAEFDAIARWSTADVPQAQRLDYFEAALAQAIFPIALNRANARTFDAELSHARLGAIDVSKAIAARHSSFRGRRELARTDDHSFQLTLTLQSSWAADQPVSCRMRPRDVLIIDSRDPVRANFDSSFTGVSILVPHTWMRQWIPNPNVLTARRIPRDSLWGLALSSYLSELSPDLIAAPPLPPAVIADQIGALLALTAKALGSAMPEYTPAARSLNERIQDCLAQRCTEPHLTAADIAASVMVSARTLHRNYAAANTTFGEKLIEARTRVALQMLTSPLFKRLTTAEIGRRAGFLSASHFVRVVRNRTGQTPLRLRRAALERESADPSEDT